MSLIHKKTLEVIAATEQPYAQAREVAVELMVTAVVAAAMSSSQAGAGDDYKDRAASLSSAIWDEVVPFDRTTRKAISAALEKRGLLNGYSCPKAFWAGLEELQTAA